MTVWLVRRHSAVPRGRTAAADRRGGGRAAVVLALSVLGLSAGSHPPAAAQAAPHASSAFVRDRGVRIGDFGTGGGAASPTPREISAVAQTAAAQPTVIRIKNFAFDPGTVTVASGQQVTWANDDPVPHTATNAQKVWDTGQLQPGGSVSVTFTKPGAYAYACTVHPFMQAAIVVR